MGKEQKILGDQAAAWCVIVIVLGAICGGFLAAHQAQRNDPIPEHPGIPFIMEGNPPDAR